MPFPTRYTRIPYIADDGSDMQLDRQQGLVWTFTGGGYSYHDPEWETLEDGPNFFKIRATDGAVLTYGRGPLPPWDIEDTTTDNNLKYDVWNIAVAPSTGNLYVSVYNSYITPRTGYIHCLDPNDFHILFSSPPLNSTTTGLAHGADWLAIVEPYIYGYSYRPGGTPQMRLFWNRLPLSLSQVDWTVETYSGIDSFEIPIDGNIAVDSAGFMWSGAMKTLAKVSPAGVVTSYNLAASLNANACIMTVGYDPATDSLGMYINLRSSNGTGAFVAPYMQIVKVNCATGAVSATYSPPTTLRFRNRPLHRAWENIQDGRVLLQLDKGTINSPENRGALLDFDLRSMRLLRIYRLAQDWGLDDTPVEPVYEESPLSTARALQELIPDFQARRIWAYNAWQGWIYPDAAYPEGTYGMWAWSLNECATYIKLSLDDWAYDRVYLDRQRGFIWQMATGGPHFVKIRAATSEVLLNQKAPGIPDWETTEFDWAVWYIGVSQETGNIYINEDNGNQGSVRCLSGTDLTLLHSSPYLQENLDDLWVRDPYVYAMDTNTYGTSPNRHHQARLTRFPLDLSGTDWSVQLWDVLSGNPGDKSFITGQQTLTLDGVGNVWYGMRTELYRVNSAGAVTVFSLAANLPSTARIEATGFDEGTNTLVMGIGNGAIASTNDGLARFDLATNTFITYQENQSFYISPGNGGATPNNWERLPNGRLWIRMRAPDGFAIGDMAEIDTRTFQIVRQYNLTSDWCITDTTENNNALNSAQRTSGYLWDDCACALWLYNGYIGAYPDAASVEAGRPGWFGLWKLPLPDLPASDCPGPQLPACAEPAWLQYFHDAVLDQYISYGCKIKIKFQTYITRMRQGHEERIGEWQDPIWTFDITPALRDQVDLDYLLAFFRARQGPMFIFKFFNPLDYQVQNEIFGYGDGTTQTFQLSRRYPTGLPGDGLYYVRPITLPALGVTVAQGGVDVEEGLWNLCPLGGTVVFAFPPPPGTELTWSGMYYTPVRFLTNRVYSVVEHYQHYEDQIMLVEERLAITAPVLNEPESPDFVEVQFPTLYAQRATMGPEIDVITVTSDSGATYRKPQFRSAKIRFTVEETEQPEAVVGSLLAFFLNRKGRLVSFRARDITDFALDQGGGMREASDGTRTTFQLAKYYGSGAQSIVRTINKPNADVVITVEGAPLDPQPTIDLGTGKVTFASPPANGILLYCTGTFDVPVRFDSDEITFSIQGFEAFNMEAMTLIETELGLPDFHIDALLPVTFAAQTSVQPRLAMAGQENCQLPPRPRVEHYLEFRGGTTGSGAGAYSGLQVERPGSMYKLLAGATSLTVAFLVSHVKSGTPSGALGAVYPMALFSHVMPGMGTDPALYPSTGFTLYLDNFGGGLALDAALGAYMYGSSGPLCVPQLTATPRVPSQGAQAASTIADDLRMHAYVVTMDWMSRQAYWSGTLYGKQDFSVEAFAYTMCLGGVAGGDARLIEATAQKYIGAKDPSLGEGETVNDAWLGTVSASPSTPPFHSPLSASVYEHLLLPTFTPVDMRLLVRQVHVPILRYWGSKYGAGFPNTQSPVAPGFDLFWWRAGENVTLADTPTGAIAAWAPVVCGFNWLKANPTALQDDGQPRLRQVTTLPVFDDVLMLADGRRLLQRQT